MKIVYCLDSIRYLGGIQKVTIVKANALSEKPKNEVFIIVTDNKKGIQVSPLSDKVHLIDLDVNYYEDDWKSRWNILKGIIVKRKEHKKKLAKVLYEIQPDIVISVGQSEKYLLTSIKGNWNTIRELHYVKIYRFFYAQDWFNKVLAYCGDIYDYQYAIKKYDQIVVLTQEDKENNWKGWKKVTVIPNPISFVSDSFSSLTNKTVVSVGRLVPQKNYFSLIRSFRYVVDKFPDWRLEIYGEGFMKNELLSLINKTGLQEKVFLRGYTSDISKVMYSSSIYVQSSLYEGFALVILEAMLCGLPVVSYAYPCGSKDIIEDGRNGFLVPVNDERKLADRICELIANEELRQRMGLAALEMSKRYTTDKIVEKWMDLFIKLRNCG